ncbi:MAG: GNAT family N-acetyltransferase, partial [Firmicutes bacterium]|nr:GNAT family N-acetyltransferase [Bacillota bacterium]
MWRVIPQARGFREHALLRDGSWVLLRVAGPDDAPAGRDLLERVSPASRRLRFLGGVGQVSLAWGEELCQPPDRDRACLLAVWGEGEAARVVGVGNYVALPGRNTAEVAFLVDDAFQGRGIGTLLLERLAGMAAGQGLVGFEADVLAENRLMVEVFQRSGFQVRQALEGGTLHVEFPVSGSAAAWERAELRERIATANSLVPLLRPRAVAVIGASRDPDSVGGMVFRYALAAGFTGTIYPVNREASSVHGVRAYPSVESLPEPVDLAIVAVPAHEAIGVARACVRAGTRALVVLTAGFAESGPEGAARQRELVETVRAWGARMLGPNCMGLINTDPRVRLNASLAPELAPRGRIGFFSHSGALGLAILSYAAERGLGFSTFVSAGNRADVSGNDLLAYWDEDPETDLVMLYLETFGTPRRFARLARRVSARKPVLCVKSARSWAGSRAAAAHIGATAQGDVEVDALFRKAGVIRADTLEEMFDVAVLLAHQPLPGGRGVAIVSNSGGVATICADACEGRGLSLSGPGVVDLGPLAGASAYERDVLEALSDPSVDAVIAIFACVAGCAPAAVA